MQPIVGTSMKVALSLASTMLMENARNRMLLPFAHIAMKIWTVMAARQGSIKSTVKAAVIHALAPKQVPLLV